MDGQNRHRAIAGTLPHVFAMSLFEDWVYWTDWNTHTVEKAHKYTGEQRAIMGNNTHRPYDIHVYHPYRQPRSMYISTADVCILNVSLNCFPELTSVLFLIDLFLRWKPLLLPLSDLQSFVSDCPWRAERFLRVSRSLYRPLCGLQDPVCRRLLQHPVPLWGQWEVSQI